MKAPNSKTPARTGVCQCSELCSNCDCNPTTEHPKIQAPRMGTALRSFLKRYARELQPYAKETGDRVATSMVDCCNLLLDESDKLESGQS